MSKKISFFIIVCFIFNLYYLSFAEEKKMAVIQKIYGKVEIYSDGKWQNATVGKVLLMSDIIKTDKSAFCIILLEDGHIVKISANSEVSVSFLLSEKIEIKLINGKLRAKVSKLQPKKEFNVITPTSVCAVRGTDFLVEYQDGITKVEVYEGFVEAKEVYTAIGVLIKEGEFTVIEPKKAPEIPAEIPQERKKEIQKEDISLDTQEEKDIQTKIEVEKEIFYDISKEAVIKRANREIKLAEYQQGKSIIDVFGNRVRIEEYIVRQQKNQFKYVVLNSRENRFDFGKIIFTFNKNLPEDLSTVAKNMFEHYGSQKPEYVLKEIHSVVSNTVDQINETAFGGDMFADNPSNPSYWRHYFKEYNFYINNKLRWNYTSVVSGDRITKIKFSYFDINGNTISAPESIFEMPSGDNFFHFREKNTYSDRVWISKDTYIIDDNGKILTTENLQEWSSENINQKAKELNFELVYRSNEFNGLDNKIDLVYSSKLLIDSGILNLPAPKEKK